MITLQLLSGTTQVLARASGLLEYNALKQTLIETFQQTYSVDSVYHELRSRRLSASESTINYFIDIKNIARKAKITEDELVYIIIVGSNDPVNTAAMRYAARQMDDLIPLLNRYEEMRIRHQPSTSAPKDRRSTRDVPMNIEHVKCYNYLQQGHYRSQCQRPQRPHGSCFRCSKTGHSHRECPNRNNVPVAAVHSINMESGYLQKISAMQEVCVTLVELSGPNSFLPPVFSLFDSGSPKSFINENLVPISLLQKPENSGYCGLGNSALLSLGRINCRMKYRKNEIKHEFIILPKNCMLWPIIVGRDVMPKFKITLAILQHQIYDKSTLLNHKLSSIIPPLKTHVAEKLRDLGILKELGGDVQVGKKLSTLSCQRLTFGHEIYKFLQYM